MSNPIKKLLGQTAVYGLPSIVGRFLNYMLVPLYTAVLPVATYGVVSELYAYVAFLIVFLTFGMETAYFHFLQKQEDKQSVFNSSFLTVILLNSSFAILLLLFFQPLSNAMLYGNHPEYIILLGIIVIIDAISAIPLAKLRAEEKAVKFAVIQFSSILVNIALNLFFLYVLYDPSRPDEGVLFILLANLVSSAVKPIVLFRDFLSIHWNFHFDYMRHLFKYAFPLMIAGMAGIINETLDRILLKQILYDGTAQSLKYATEQVGIYSACYKLAMLVTIFLQAYRYAAEPFFFAQSKSLDRDKQYRRIMNFLVAVLSLLFLIVTLNIDLFKLFIRSDAFYVGLKVVPILLLANVFLGIYINQSIWYKLSGQTKFGAYIAIGGAMVTILINVIFIPTAGYMASAYATLIVYAGQTVASFLLSRKYFPIKYNIRKFFLYIGTALVLFFLGNAFQFENNILTYFSRNALIVFFMAMVWNLEKSSLKTQK